jgi:hypothetical protein
MDRPPITLALVVCAAVGFTAITGPSFGSDGPITRAVAKPRSGNYKGTTTQQSVVASARRITFRVKSRRITLTTEPVVRRDFCLTPPVFIEEEGQVVTKKISRNGTFSFERTFVGQKVNRIRGTFVDDHTIEGTATYHFPASASGQCSAGKESPRFTAER